MIQRYLASPLDHDARLRTWLTMAAFVALLILVLFIRQIAPPATLLAVPLIIFPALAYAITPLGYAVDDQAIWIERKTLGTIRIPLNQISAVQPLPRAALKNAIRIYGTGGLFGWAGRYRLRGLGSVTMHATNLDRLILITRRKRRAILISPADPSALLRGLQRQYETIEVPPRAGAHR